MKPGSRDIKHEILITGDELKELKRHSYLMVEAFGLDRRIENYQGKRPIGFYRWDLDCLMYVVSEALNNPKEYPFKESKEYHALKNLHDELRKLHQKAYSE